MNKIDIKYMMTEEMYMNAFSYYWQCKGRPNKVNVKKTIMLLSIGLCFLVGYILHNAYYLLLVSAILFFIGAILEMVLPSYTNVVWRRRYRKDEDFKGKNTATFDKSGVHIQRAVNAYDHRWEKFNGYISSPKFVYLYISDDHFIFIPWSAFTGKQLAAFTELLNSKLKQTSF